MASIDGVRYGTYQVDSAGPAPSGRGGFALPAEDSTAASRSAGPNAGPVGDIASLPAGMLAAQEFGSERPAERAARRQGMLVLRQLDALQLAWLSTGPGDEAFTQLAGLTEALDEAMARGIDPRLRKMLALLALRARIELARPRGGSLALPER